MVPTQGGTPEDGAWIRLHSEGVEWLGRNWAEVACTVAAGRRAAGQELPEEGRSGADHGLESGALNEVG